MNAPLADSVQQQIADYAATFAWDALTPAAIHVAKARLIDTLGVLIAGFDGAPDRKSTRLNSSHVSESRMPSSA